MSITPTTLIDVETQAEIDETWDIAYLFHSPWNTEQIMSVEWRTSVAEAQSSSEKRFGLVDKPYRSFTSQFVAYGRKNIRALKNWLRRLSMANNAFPVCMERVRVTNVVSTTIMEVSGYASERIFQSGCRVAVAHAPMQGMRFESFELTTCTNAANEYIYIAAPSTPVSEGDFIYPIIEIRPNPVIQITNETDQMMVAVLTVFENVGASAYDATHAGGTTPSGVNEYGGYPVLELFGDWVSTTETIQQSADIASLGLGFSIEVFGSSPRDKVSFVHTALTRAAMYELQVFFDSRRGRLYPFYALSPSFSYDVVSLSGTTLTVTKDGPELDTGHIDKIYFRHKDGSIEIRDTLSIAPSGSVWVIELDSSLPVGWTWGSTVQRVGDARLSRFALDELQMSFTTDEVGVARVELIQVLQEKSKTVSYV